MYDIDFVIDVDYLCVVFEVFVVFFFIKVVVYV